MNAHTGWCEGCRRTIDEIAAWSTMSDEDKLIVWARLDERREPVVPPQTEGETRP
jgi:predicted Fe-S protein YdhL (DUF1289 family)